MGEESLTTTATRQDAAELHRVELVALATGPRRVGAASGPGKYEGEGLVVAARPLGNHIGDEPSVVSGAQHQLRAGSPSDVDAVHPGVAGQDDVEQIPERPRALERGTGVEGSGADLRRRVTPASDGAGHRGSQRGSQLVGRLGVMSL